MNIVLTEQDVDTLRGLLQSHLPDLQREAARTQRHDLRHILVERLNLAERLLREMMQPAR